MYCHSPVLKCDLLVFPFSLSPSRGLFLESAISGLGHVSIPASAAIFAIALDVHILLSFPPCILLVLSDKIYYACVVEFGEVGAFCDGLNVQMRKRVDNVISQRI